VSGFTTPLDVHAFTPKFALKYQYSPNGQVYANAVKGFRLGGENLPVPLSPSNPVGAACLQDMLAYFGHVIDPLTYNPDSIWSYEIGNKSTLFSNRLSIDASVYHIVWNGVQQDVVLAGPNQNCGGYDFITNAGRAQSNGGDLQLNAQITSRLSAYVAGNITHATITQAAPGTAETEGNWLEGVPRWTALAGGTYAQPIRGVTGTFSVNGHWTGPSHQFFQPSYVGYLMPEYFVMDANIGVETGKWNVSLFVENLLNNMTDILQNTSPPNYGISVAPRTIGITAQVNF
jgi:outer membrane receptor protein involved in Fe transport